MFVLYTFYPYTSLQDTPQKTWLSNLTLSFSSLVIWDVLEISGSFAFVLASAKHNSSYLIVNDKKISLWKFTYRKNKIWSRGYNYIHIHKLTKWSQCSEKNINVLYTPSCWFTSLINCLYTKFAIIDNLNNNSINIKCYCFVDVVLQQ